MVAMAAIEKAPLATPSKTTLALSGHVCDKAEPNKPTVAKDDAKQPPTIHA